MAELHVTAREFADKAGVERRTVMRWIAQGRIEAHKDPSGYWRIPVAEIERMDFSATEFARAVGVNRRTVVRWCEAGKVECSKTPGGHWRIPRHAIERVGRMKR